MLHKSVIVLLEPICKYDVVRARVSFCSLDETQEPPYGYHENTGVSLL